MQTRCAELTIAILSSSGLIWVREVDGGPSLSAFVDQSIFRSLEPVNEPDALQNESILSDGPQIGIPALGTATLANSATKGLKQ